MLPPQGLPISKVHSCGTSLLSLSWFLSLPDFSQCRLSMQRFANYMWDNTFLAVNNLVISGFCNFLQDERSLTAVHQRKTGARY